MSLNQEQIKALKAQLESQIANLPSDQKAQAKQQIDSLTEEQLEAMLQQQSQNTIFRQIANKELPSKVIGENSDAIAVLEIRPLTEGHTLIIPKKQITKKEDITPKTLELISEVAEKINNALSPKSAEILKEIKFGEVIVEILPNYGKPINKDSERKQKSEANLEKTYKKITSFVKIERKPKIIQKTPKPKKVKKKDLPKIKRRIP